MHKIKLWGIPELFLLLALLMGLFFKGHITLDILIHDTYFVADWGMLLMRLSIPVIISWIFHVVLRSKYPASFPGLGSWTHVVLSVFCLGALYYAFSRLDFKLYRREPDLKEWDVFMFWNSWAVKLILLLTGMQPLFWIMAIRSLWTRREKRKKG